MRPREEREKFQGRRQLLLDDVERPALAVPVGRIHPGTHDELALVRLGHVDVNGTRHDNGRVNGLQQLRHERLERVALERQPDPGHGREQRGMARRHDRDAPRGDRATRGLDARDPLPVDVDPGHLGALDEIDPQRVGGSGVSPRDVVVLGDPGPRLVRGTQHRVADVRRNVDDRTEAGDIVRRKPFGIDSSKPVRVDPAHPGADIARAVGEADGTALAEQEVVVEILGETLPELE